MTKVIVCLVHLLFKWKRTYVDYFDEIWGSPALVEYHYEVKLFGRIFRRSFAYGDYYWEIEKA